MSDDPFYEQAKQASTEHGFVSIGFLQRNFRIGYLRAARLIDAMIDDGFCSSACSNTGLYELTSSTSPQEFGDNGNQAKENAK